MFNFYSDEDYIMKLIKEGKSSDDIAKEFTDTLNSAIKKVEDAEKAKKEAELKKEHKLAAACLVAATLNDFATEYYDYDEDLFIADQVVELFDDIFSIRKSFSALDIKKLMELFDI